jgi:peptide methionine sulfoxide reductase MsrA
MKRLLLLIKLFSFFALFTTVTVNAEKVIGTQPTFNKVYRSDRVGDSYHFFLLTKSGTYYHVFTNKTDKLTASELKSSKILTILKNKQSWGKAFPKHGKYTVSQGKLYTKLLWNRIKVISPKKIKYLNKLLYLQ